MAKQMSLNLKTNRKKLTPKKIETNAEKHMLDHPCDVTKMVIDCFLSDYCFGIDQEVGDALILDPQDIQTISASLVRIMSYNQQLVTTQRLADKYYEKSVNLKDTEEAIADLLGDKVIRYVPYGSKLHKDLKKILKKSGYGVEGLIDGMSDNLFGYFYAEPKSNNVIKKLIASKSSK